MKMINIYSLYNNVIVIIVWYNYVFFFWIVFNKFLKFCGNLVCFLIYLFVIGCLNLISLVCRVWLLIFNVFFGLYFGSLINGKLIYFMCIWIWCVCFVLSWYLISV